MEGLPMRNLIAYDVTDSRRLRKVQRWIQQYAHPLQRSVWLFDGGEAGWKQCLEGLQQRLDLQADRLLTLPLTPLQQITHHGVCPMGDDVLFF